MTPQNHSMRARQIEKAIDRFEKTVGPLPGLVPEGFRTSFIRQIVDSEQRANYPRVLAARGVDPASADPSTTAFDPLRASIVHNHAGNYDEAAWMIFLFVHFGKHRRAGWRYARDIYGRLGSSPTWDWAAVSSDVTSFRYWLDENQDAIRSAPGPQGFGNHRKYESLNAWEDSGTGAAVESYVDWVLEAGSGHEARFDQVRSLTPQAGFDRLYKSMDVVMRFGRVARFDYLTMLMKIGLLNIAPGHTYLKSATGPLRGASLLVHGDPTSGSPRDLEKRLDEVAGELQITPDVLEDAICNWQKKPETYVRFSG